MFILLAGCESRNETIVNSPLGNTAIEDTAGLIDGGNENANCTDFTQYLGANIIVNGSFEEGHNLGNNQWDVFDQVGAWYADTTYSDAGIEIQTGQTIGGLAPSDGNSKLEFDAHNKNGFSASDVEVYQTMDTDIADDYILTFDYSPRVQGDEQTNAAEVFWDGDLIATLNSEVKGWQKYTLIVKGAGNVTRLSFKGYVDNNTLGGYLDNVTLTKLLDSSEGSSTSIEVTTCIY